MAAQEERMTAKKERKQQRRAKKRKAQRVAQPSGQQMLLKRARMSEALKNAPIVVNPEDTAKMSDVILRFAAPLLHGADGIVDKNVIRFAIGVWNASLLPKPAQAKALKSIVAILPAGDHDARRELVAAMFTLLTRKQTYFADNTRVILDYQITQSGYMLHLDVVSTLGKDYHPDT
jgi:hypothetical protein